MSLEAELDTNIKPGDDFYKFVNQRWIDAHPMPDDKARYDIWDVLTDTNLDQLQQLLEAKSSPDEAIPIRTVKKYYLSAMDTDLITKTTPKIVAKVIDSIQSLKTPADIVGFITSQHRQGLGLVWQIGVDPDDKNSRQYLTRIWQGGLGLPEKTYYFDDQFKEIRNKYIDYLTDVFKLIEFERPAERAHQVYAIEEALAEASLTTAECRDPERVYNLFTPAKLDAKFAALDWNNYLATIGLPAPKQVNVSQPDFLTKVTELLAEQPIENWQNYLTIRALHPLANKLSQPYEDLQFGFYGKVLTGRKEQEPRPRRIIRICMATLPEPIGRLFIEHYFDENAKAEIGNLVGYIQTALGRRIKNLDWMADDTKAKALHKLSTFMPLLGYPDKWKSYDSLKLDNSYVDNFLATCQFEWNFQTGRLHQPVDRKEWLMSPALVNAYYWPSTNGITFPAAILQPPFFDAAGDFAANYGAIGAVIGHELTHGFDDEGSKFDADGNLKSWWSPKDRKDFDSRAQKLAQQYSSYQLAGRNLDGQLTLGENIADLGGLLIAYDALQAKLKELGKRAVIDGFTPEQRFFISFARAWGGSARDELILQRLVSDPHSPEVFRVNGVLPNVDAFYEAFNVQPGDKLYLAPDKRVRIW